MILERGNVRLAVKVGLNHRIASFACRPITAWTAFTAAEVAKITKRVTRRLDIAPGNALPLTCSLPCVNPSACCVRVKTAGMGSTGTTVRSSVGTAWTRSSAIQTANVRPTVRLVTNRRSASMAVTSARSASVVRTPAESARQTPVVTPSQETVRQAANPDLQVPSVWIVKG